MPRRKELKGIANSLISLDLIEVNTLNSSALLQGISGNCAGYFSRQLESRKIPRSWVRNAIIEITFIETVNEPKMWGKEFMCFQLQLTIISDLGAKFYASSNGACVTHTPQKERRRSGF